MNRRFSLVSTGFIFIVLLVQSPPFVVSGFNTSLIRVSDETSFNLNSTMIGVSDDDSFTYVLGKYDVPLINYMIYRNSTSGEELNVKEHQEFTITIANATPVKSGDYYTFTHRMSVEFSNSTFSMLGEVPLYLLSYIVFTDWNYTYDQTHKFLVTLKNSADLRSFEIIDGEDEFMWWAEKWGPVQYVEYRFDKVTGMQLYSYIEGEEDGVSVIIEIYQKGYTVSIRDTTTSSDTTPNTVDTAINVATTTLTGGFDEDFISTNEDLTSKTSTSSSDVNLPGFQFYMVIFALITTITALRRKE